MCPKMVELPSCASAPCLPKTVKEGSFETNLTPTHSLGAGLSIGCILRTSCAVDSRKLRQPL